MTEIERRLRELGSAAGQSVWDGPLDPRARRRIRRRRVMIPGAAVCALLAVAASGTLLPVEPRRPSSVTSVVAPAASTASSPRARPLAVREVAEDGFSAVWPEDNPADATSGCTEATPGSFRADPVATAVAFGREVMGWREATPSVTGSTPTSRQVELRRDAAPSPRVNVSVVELVDDCWAVQSVFDVRGDPHTGLVVDSTAGETDVVVQVRFEAPAGTSGEVEVGYGDYVERRTWHGPVTMDDPVVVELAERPDTTGHLFVLFADDAGSVVKALAYSLPPRHFSKEARDRAAGP